MPLNEFMSSIYIELKLNLWYQACFLSCSTSFQRVAKRESLTGRNEGEGDDSFSWTKVKMMGLVLVVNVVKLVVQTRTSTSTMWVSDSTR